MTGPPPMSATDLPVSGAGANGSGASLSCEGFHGEALQAADLDRLLVVAMQHAGAFAEDIHGTGARAACAEDVGVEDGLCRAFEVIAGDLLDEARDVDVRGTGGRAGRVEAVEAAVGFSHGGRLIERRMQVRKARSNLRTTSGHCSKNVNGSLIYRSCTPLPAGEFGRGIAARQLRAAIQLLPVPADWKSRLCTISC